MGWLIAALVLGVIGIGVSAAYNDAQLSEQEESNRLNLYNTSIGELNSSTTKIENTLRDIQTVESKNDTSQSTIDTGNEWIENYRKMLDGDRTDTTLGRELYGYEAKKKSAEADKASYLISSKEQKQTAYDTAYQSYTQALKQRSLLNVAASGTGQLEGAYSVANLIQNQKIRLLVGNDMVFNSNGEGTSLSDGSFLVQYTGLKQQIASDIDTLTSAIEIANGNIKDFYDNSETSYNKWQADIEDAEKAIELNNGTIETYKQVIKNEQTNALTALKKAMESKKSDTDQAQIDSYGERLDAANKSIEDYTGESSGYNAADTIEEMKSAQKKTAAASESASESSSTRDRDYDDTWAQTQEDRGERLVDKEKALKEAEEAHQAQKAAEAANERGKSQTEYYRQQQKQAEEEKKTKTSTKEKTTTRKRVVS